LNSTVVAIKIDEDIKMFQERFKIKETLCKKEEFIPYEIYKKTLETSAYNSNNSSKGNELNTNNETFTQSNNGSTSPLKTSMYNSLEKGELVMNNISEDFEFINESHFYSENYQNNLIEGFMRQLFLEKEIEVDSMGKLMEILYNNNNFSKTFIDYILRDRKNLFFKFLNYQNLQHFANILNTVSLNLDNIQNENYDLNFAIIFIAERTFFIDPNNSSNKVYLS
jgi:hypothetical protein